MPAAPWRWRLGWHELAFLHYRVRAEAIQRLLPPGLKVQEFDGTGWVGIVPFRMTDVAYRNWPAAPTLRSFPEVNLRTYVEGGGRPGVWFFSLDADSMAMALGGRWAAGLPYFRSSIQMKNTRGTFDCESRRRHEGVRYAGSYRPVGATLAAEAGSLAHWATERYCLYARRRGRLVRQEVHHAPWPLQAAEADVRVNELTAWAGIELLSDAPIVHYSPGVEVVAWAPEEVAG